MGIVESVAKGIAKLKGIATRTDSWINPRTGTGIGYGRTAFELRANCRIDDATLEEIYFSDPYASRICKCVPEEALRRGFSLYTGDKGMDKALHDQWDAHHLTAKFVEAWTWGRLFGGGAILMGVDDGRDVWEPLDLENIYSVDYFAVLDKRELTPVGWYDDPAARNYGEPAIYRLNRVGAVSVDTSEVHASRIVRFEGAMTNRLRRRQNNSWSESELQRVYTAVQQFNGAYASVATLLQDASQGVFSVKGLLDLLAADATDDVKKRLQYMDETRGANRAIVIDAEDEDFKRVDVAGLGGGLPATIDKFMYLLAGAAEMPVTVLMGQAPAGENATGASDIRWFYDRIDSSRTQVLLPRISRVARVLAAPMKRRTVGVGFPSMYSQTPKEAADTEKTHAEADKIYQEMGALQPSEIRASRFADTRGERRITLDPNAQATPKSTAAPANPHVDSEFAKAMPILEKVAARAIPRSTGVKMLAGMGIAPERAEEIMGDVGTSHFTSAPLDHEQQLATMKSNLAKSERSKLSSSSMLKRILEANRRGVLVSHPIMRRADADDALDPVRWFESAMRLDSKPVAIMLPVPPDAMARVAIDAERSPDPHCTLMILGAPESLTTDQLSLVRAVLRTWAARQFPIACKFSGVGRFAGTTTDPVYVTPSAQSLAALREDLIDVLGAVGIGQATEYGFVPHVTLAYVPSGSPMPTITAPAEPFTFDRVELWVGDQHEAFPFASAGLAPSPPLAMLGSE
jgi:phage-related protein (TIGR01555 family)